MLAISQLLLTRFWWNFKCRFLGTSSTDFNCQGDICPRNICPRDICPYQEYLSSNWPNFDETLKIGSWEHLQQIPTVWGTFVQTTFVQMTFVHIRNISSVTDPILAKLKGFFLRPSLTDAKCQVNVCPGAICPYQEYLSCYWPDFNKTLKVSSWTIFNRCQMSS